MRLAILAIFAITSVASAQTVSEITASEWDVKTYVAHRDIVAYGDITEFFTEFLPAAYGSVVSAELEPGPASGLYWEFNEETGKFDMAAAVPFSGKAPADFPEGIEVIELPPSSVLSAEYHGPYENLRDAHEVFGEYLSAEGLEPAYVVVEEYITDPMSEPDSSKWLTRIHYVFPK